MNTFLWKTVSVVVCTFFHYNIKVFVFQISAVFADIEQGETASTGSRRMSLTVKYGKMAAMDGGSSIFILQSMVAYLKMQHCVIHNSVYAYSLDLISPSPRYRLDILYRTDHLWGQLNTNSTNEMKQLYREDTTVQRMQRDIIVCGYILSKQLKHRCVLANTQSNWRVERETSKLGVFWEVHERREAKVQVVVLKDKITLYLFFFCNVSFKCWLLQLQFSILCDPAVQNWIRKWACYKETALISTRYSYYHTASMAFKKMCKSSIGSTCVYTVKHSIFSKYRF